MKRLKVFAAVLTIAVLAIGFSAFTLPSYHSKAFAFVCKYYTGTPIPRTGALNGTQQAAFFNAANWNGFQVSCLGSNFLCSICYDNSGETYSLNFSGPIGIGSVLDEAWNARSIPGWTAGTIITGTDNDGDGDGIIVNFKN